MASPPTPSQDFNLAYPANYLYAVTGISSSPTQSVNEVHNLTVSATSGTFTLSLDATTVGLGNITTGAITYSANTTTLASNIQAALDSAFGSGRCTVTGNNAPYSLTWASTYGGLNIPTFTGSTTGLVGGTITATSVTAGVTGTLGRIAPKSALLIDVDNKKLYINTGDDFKQTWTVVGSQS